MTMPEEVRETIAEAILSRKHHTESLRTFLPEEFFEGEIAKIDATLDWLSQQQAMQEMQQQPKTADNMTLDELRAEFGND